MLNTFFKQNYKLFVIASLFLLGFIIYSNSFSSSFHFDDSTSITNNTAIRNIKDLNAIWNFWPTRFITYLTFALNYHFYQLNVFGYHLFNFAVHLCSAILVWWLLSLTFSTSLMKDEKISQHSKLISFFVALIFLVHPIQTQAVTYIVQRATSLATLFYLLSLSLYVKSRLLQYEKRPSNIWKFYYIGSCIIAILAIFTKEMTITLPFMFLIYEPCFLKTEKKINWKPIIPFFVILLLIPVTMFVTKSVDFLEMRRMPEAGPIITPLRYLLTQFKVIVTYLGLLFVPLNQNLDYDYPISKSFLELPTLASFLFLIIILVIAFRLFAKYRLLSFSIFWFFLTLLPESSIIPIKDVIFEHRLYLPMVGYSIFLISIIYYLCQNKNIILMITILALIVNFYAPATYNRNFDWQDRLVLLNDTIHKSPRKARPYINRGFLYLNLKEDQKAVSDFDKALMLYYEKLGIKQSYADTYKEILKTGSGYSEIYNLLAVKFAEIGSYEAAALLFKNIIEKNPSGIQAYINLSALYGDSKRYKEAIAMAKKAIEINPNSAQAHYNLSAAYYFDNQYDLAFKHFEIATKLGFKPDPEFSGIIEQYRKKHAEH